MKSKLPWPVWIPYPCSWLRACLNVLLLWLMIICAHWTGVWGRGFTSLSPYGDDAFFSFPIFVLLGMSFPFILVAVVHNLFWRDRPNWWPRHIPSPKSLIEATNAVIAMVFGLSLGVGLLFLDLAAEHQPLISPYDTEAQLKAVLGVWFITAAYLYQMEFCTRRRRRDRRKRKYQKQASTSSAPSPAPIDPVEAELQQMKSQLGHKGS